MAEEKRIVWQKTEYVELLKQNIEVLAEVVAVHEASLLIVGEVLIQRTAGNLPFYMGKARDGMEQYYTMLSENLGNLNQLYSKLLEYLDYIAKELKISDEYIAAHIKGRQGER